jgi:hypothetical protein
MEQIYFALSLYKPQKVFETKLIDTQCQENA